MNDIHIMLLTCWPFMALSGVFLYRLFFHIKAYRDQKRHKKVYPSLIKINQEGDCDIHDWDKIKLAMPELPVDTYMVCKRCAYVSGTDYKLNKPGHEVYLSELRGRQDRKEKWEKIARLRIELLDLHMNRLIRDSVEDFKGDLTQNIMHLQKFFRKAVVEVDTIYTHLNKEDKGRG